MQKGKTVKELENKIKDLNKQLSETDDNRKFDRLYKERIMIEQELEKKRKGRKALVTRSIRFDPDDLRSAELEGFDVSEICRKAVSNALASHMKKVLKGALG